MANKRLVNKIINEQEQQINVLDNLIDTLDKEYRKLESSGDDFLLLNIESDLRIAKAKKEAIKSNVDILKLML